ncbi:nucleoside recognition domain-containing protein [Gracilibacillus marinus]|uniref:Nucleoside recognition domain-containing protein n=1 Tax=Gracilibacillus marinus TaxID=630535 RepID=A0ABV8VY63_9BACI
MSVMLYHGLKQGLATIWTLGKVIFPITLLVTILQFTPVLPWIIALIEPVMGLLGLSGEAAVPLVLGNALIVSGEIRYKCYSSLNNFRKKMFTL